MNETMNWRKLIKYLNILHRTVWKLIAKWSKILYRITNEWKWMRHNALQNTENTLTRDQMNVKWMNKSNQPDEPKLRCAIMKEEACNINKEEKK